MTPREAKTYDDICELERDNIDLSGKESFALLGVDMITIHAAENEEVILYREEFEKLIYWYNTGKVKEE